MNYKAITRLAVAAGTLILAASAGAEERAPRLIDGTKLGLGNELIDFTAFAKAVEEAGKHRESRRVTEEQFIAMSKEANTIVLDTRSAAKFALLHVKGAVHLNFSEITKGTLAKTIPTKETRILIYCNNNFDNEPVAFESKAPTAALNLPTYVTLYSYGYKNVYELGPLLDIRKTKIELNGMKFAQR